MLGEFLEISLSTGDILASVQFYERLGFRHAQAGETWRHPYAVLSDGHLYLGLHQYAFPAPALTFVLPGLRSKLAPLAVLGIEFEFCKLTEDDFNEAGFYAPERQMITLLEARTYSPLRSAAGGESLCGYFREYRLPVHDRESSWRFWERLGFVTTDANPGTPAGSRWLSTGGLNIGLPANPRERQVQLVFEREHTRGLGDLLEQRNITFKPDHDDDGAATLSITAPEGTRLLIRGVDF